MIRNIQRTWFEVWGNEAAQNHILKWLLLFLTVLCAILVLSVSCLSLRKPVLIAVSHSATQVLLPSTPSDEMMTSEVKRVVSKYVEAHDNWRWDQIDSSFKRAANFVAPSFRKQFLAANATQEKIAQEKKLSQLFYISTVTLDLKAKTATVEGDRILIIDTLRADTPMTFQVSFDYAERTTGNPEGIYVTAEKLISENK